MTERAAIRVRYLGPTNHRGSRYKVIDRVHGMPTLSYTHDWDYSISNEENREAAAAGFLARHRPECELTGVALVFDGDTFFTWKHKK